MPAPGSADVDALYAVPPSEFTAARNALAARLRGAGRAGEARGVAARRKPSAVLWAINQLARRHRDEVGRFLEAVERVRKTQLSGGAGVAAAAGPERTARDALVRLAREILAAAGARVSAAATRAISNTLLGAAADRGRADQLRRGALDVELPAPGFEAWLGAGAPRLRLVNGRNAVRTPAPDRARPPTGPPPSAAAPARGATAPAAQRAPSRRAMDAGARARRDSAAARAAVARLEGELEARRRGLAEAERDATEAREAAEGLRRQAGEAAETAARLHREAATAQTRHAGAARAVTSARRALDRAARTLDRARRRVDRPR
jgi:hypothetical protein